MVQRLTRKLSDVAQEVELQLKAHYNVTNKDLAAWRYASRVCGSFPLSNMVPIADLWIDYEVQRDVLHKHIINIMKKWDSQICSPVSACRLVHTDRINTYDGQHRTISAAILGFVEVPCAVVVTDDKNFASYAFEMLNDTGVKRLTPGDLHRNALVRFKNGSRDIKVVRARAMQDQFDSLGIDLQDKNSRSSPALRGDNDYFMSHFKYAQKGIELDESGQILNRILSAVKTVFPMQEEIDQGCYIGLVEIQRLVGTNPTQYNLPDNWMVQVLTTARKSFKSSGLVHSKSKTQWEYSHPGAGWNAPLAMSNFLRELHIRNGGSLNLPFHGDASKTGVEDGNVAPGLFPQETV